VRTDEVDQAVKSELGAQLMRNGRQQLRRLLSSAAGGDASSAVHKHVAGRLALGRPSPTTLSVNGVHHVRHTAIDETVPGALAPPVPGAWTFARPLDQLGRAPAKRGTAASTRPQEHTMVVGGACSAVFSGKNLHRVLLPGYELESRAMEALARGEPAPPLSIHTSAGSPPALGGFVQALKQHLPWPGLVDTTNLNPRRDLGPERHAAVGEEYRDLPDNDWFVSLQVEGASAVWAAVDLLMQLQSVRGRTNARKIAVGQFSYHGPPATSLGAGNPMPSLKPRAQLQFPVPALFSKNDLESDEEFHARISSEQDAFLDEHAHEIGVLLVEPQWGSSVAAQPWPKELLKSFIERAQSRGILVCCDEIMCGLGRHGQGPGLFLSDHRNWDLRPDAVTFGKAIGGGVYPMSGCIVRRGARALGAEGRSVLQSHTYSGASTRALMAGQAVLEELPAWLSHVQEMGIVCKEIFRDVELASGGAVTCQGQGLMWGGIFDDPNTQRRQAAAAILKRHCVGDGGVWPYFVPVGGFMVTPPIDTTEADLREMGRRLVMAMSATADETQGFTG